MSKITRKTQKLFGSTAGANQIEQFGSLAGGTPVYTTDIATIQALAAWLEGWYGGVVGANLPAIQDLNALCYVFAYQLCYMMQSGIPEWDAATTYYTGSLVTAVGTGQIYVSLTDTNLNNAVTDSTNWRGLNQPKKDLVSVLGSWTAPAGVTQITLKSRLNYFDYSNLSTRYISQDAWEWGDNTFGQCGNSSATLTFSSPVLVVGGSQWAMIQRASRFSMGLDQRGNLYGWGSNIDGNLGAGNTTTVSSPVAVVGGNKFTQVQASWVGINNSYSTIALDDGGQIWAWGRNTKGECGQNSTATSAYSSPVLVLGGLSFRKCFSTALGGINTALSGFMNAGLTKAGNLYTWGYNKYGNLGTGDSLNYSSPIAVVGGLTFSQIKVNTTMLGLDTSGNAWAWGYNANGQCGDGVGVVNRSSPFAVVGGLKFSSVFLNPQNVLTMAGITSAGAMYTWGYNVGGLCGNNVNATAAYSSPVLVVGGISWKFFNQSLLPTASLGIDVNGNLYAWGDNTFGQCGQNSTAVSQYSSPVLVVGSHKWSWVGLLPFGNAIFGLTTDGSLYTWGDNTDGSGGLGDNIPRSSPTLVTAFKWKTNPTVFMDVFTVTPGTVYPVTFDYPYITFGPYQIPYGDFLDVIYEV